MYLPEITEGMRKLILMPDTTLALDYVLSKKENEIAPLLDTAFTCIDLNIKSSRFKNPSVVNQNCILITDQRLKPVMVENLYTQGAALTAGFAKTISEFKGNAYKRFLFIGASVGKDQALSQRMKAALMMCSFYENQNFYASPIVSMLVSEAGDFMPFQKFICDMNVSAFRLLFLERNHRYASSLKLKFYDQLLRPNVKAPEKSSINKWAYSMSNEISSGHDGFDLVRLLGFSQDDVDVGEFDSFIDEYAFKLYGTIPHPYINEKRMYVTYATAPDSAINVIELHTPEHYLFEQHADVIRSIENGSFRLERVDDDDDDLSFFR